MQTNTLNAELRTETGKNACNKLRSKGLIPAVVYSHGTAEAIQIEKKAFKGVFKGHISESVLIDLKITNKNEDNEIKIFVKDYLRDPVTDELLHLDFYKITAGEKIQTKVAIEITGTSKGERLGGIMEVHERELEVECLPKDLTEKFVIDVTNLEIGDSIHIKDIEVSGSMHFLSEGDRVVVSIMAPKAVAEEGVAEEGEEAAEEGEGAAEVKEDSKDSD